MIKKFISTIILSLKGYSLLRIYQIHACKIIKLKAKSIEFGAYKDKVSAVWIWNKLITCIPILSEVTVSEELGTGIKYSGK